MFHSINNYSVGLGFGTTGLSRSKINSFELNLVNHFKNDGFFLSGDLYKNSKLSGISGEIGFSYKIAKSFYLSSSVGPSINLLSNDVSFSPSFHFSMGYMLNNKYSLSFGYHLVSGIKEKYGNSVLMSLNYMFGGDHNTNSIVPGIAQSTINKDVDLSLTTYSKKNKLESVIESNKIVGNIYSNIYYKLNSSSSLLNTSLASKIKGMLYKNKNYHVNIYGYSDPLGGWSEYNLLLSKKRALNVQNQLIDYGIPAFKLSSFAMWINDRNEKNINTQNLQEKISSYKDNRVVLIAIKK